jgi:hypothetical protein
MPSLIYGPQNLEIAFDHVGDDADMRRKERKALFRLPDDHVALYYRGHVIPEKRA